jgi:hypothetical protein
LVVFKGEVEFAKDILWEDCTFVVGDVEDIEDLLEGLIIL